MKKFSLFSNYFFLIIAVSIFGLISCGDDPIFNNDIPPLASISADAEFDFGEPIILTISGEQGDTAMNLLTITEDGSTIDFSRISSVGMEIGANPALLLGPNANSFTFTVEIEGPTIPGVYSYAANISDLNGNSDGASTEVTVLDVVATPPTINYAGPLSFQLGVDEPNNFNISAMPGSSDLSTIAVFEDGELINPARLEFNDVDFDVNPFSLVGDDVSGFDMAAVTVTFDEPGTTNLTFEVIDVNGESATTEEIIVEAVNPGTPITGQFTGTMVSNASGPASALGGLDLDTGANVGSSDDTRDIIDLGLDLTTGEWRQQIQGVLGTELRAADPNANPELFNFANIDTREAIMAAFDSGLSADPSNMVQEGDVFIANRGTDFFIMTVTAITVTPNDNLDFYLFDIKASAP